MDTVKNNAKNIKNWPHLIMYFVGWLLAVLVFGCVSDGPKDGDFCYYGMDSPTSKGQSSKCGFAVFVGVTAWLFTMMEIALILYPIQMFASDKFRLSRFAYHALWTLFWFATSIDISDGVSKTCDNVVDCTKDDQYTNAGAAVVFAWFSFFFWIGLTYVTYREWKKVSPPAQSDAVKLQDEDIPVSDAATYFEGETVHNNPATDGQSSYSSGGDNENISAANVV
eukprot:TRINITY_DN6887_c0_g1::TRINITY_DN6887_c0_g1_i1::g.17403::m.17403 TRINITY_DN6887_c0_g1::TRINITY_DN6887_c0_g1_i1::g.17403  ORF type:complete len:224 (-),score=37.00,sp/O55100/SNG1_MOUSE/27.95/4e-11,MARVEL/PF01284.18/3.8e-17 TRINITY_DN6887_c0_g1_i1:6-677(-)